jgi:hypothetical protein
MRRILTMLFILILLMACRMDLGSNIPTSTFPPSATNTATTRPATITATVLPPTLTPTASPSPSATPLPTQTSTPPPPAPRFRIEYHPDGNLYTGDQVSISVLAPPDTFLEGANLTIQIDQPGGLTIGPAGFGGWGIAGRNQVTFIWGWDTRSLEAGEYSLHFSIDPQGYSFTDTVTLLPASAIPPAQAGAEWATTNTECCAVHYITGSAAERDLFALTTMIDQQAQRAASSMEVDFTEPITITILPRLLGHGGFAADEISVSYLDRNYAANSWEMVVHHEMIHILDRRMGGDLRPSMLVEGLAVYMSGGHYKPEPLLPRAAALLDDHLNIYIPLAVLADDFYSAQHEIGYMEAGALIEYLVGTFGWEAYSTFYRDIHPVAGAGQAASIDTALQAHFGLTLAQIEQDFITFLRGQQDTGQWQEDVRITVLYFDTLRRYQQLMDPSAYFRTAWLMDGPSMRERGIVADFLRHPSQPSNLALETLFITASDDWVNGDFSEADRMLTIINQVLDSVEQEQTDPFSRDRMSTDYLSIAVLLQQNGYELQNIELSGETASVLVTAQDMDLIELHLIQIGSTWQIE